MRRTRRAAHGSGPARLAAALAFALAFGLAGCGDDDGPDGGDRSPRTPSVDWSEPADQQPAGVVIVLHGGGWQPNPAGFRQQRAFAAAFRQEGYATAVVRYGEGADGYRDVARTYSRARKRYPNLPICAYGVSAGGHLALMLASREPELDCVIDVAGPTDLTSLEEQGSHETHRFAVDAFGEDELAKFSPARFADRIEAKVLVVLAETDPLVAVEQGRQLAERSGAEILVLPEGPQAWVHGAGVTDAAAAEANQRQRDFLRETLQGS